MLELVQEAKTWIVFYLTRWLSPKQAVLLDGLVRGLGRTTFTLTETEGESDLWLQELIERVDRVIRQAPNPVGIDDFLIRVRVFKRPPHGSGPERRTDPGLRHHPGGLGPRPGTARLGN